MIINGDWLGLVELDEVVGASAFPGCPNSSISSIAAGATSSLLLALQ